MPDPTAPRPEPPAALSYESPPYRAGEVQYWVNGSLLDVRNNAALPDRCVKCDAPGTGRQYDVKLDWVDPMFRRRHGWIGYIPYLGGFYKRQANQEERRYLRVARVSVGLCRAHERWRRLTIFGAWAMLTAVAAVFVFATMGNKPDLAQATVVIGILAGILAWKVDMSARRCGLRAMRIEHGVATVQGCGETFLRSLPAEAPAKPASSRAPSNLADATRRLSKKR